MTNIMIRRDESMEIIRVTKSWQRAAVHWLRIQVFVEGQGIPLEMEFDVHDGDATRYVLILENNRPIATARVYGDENGTARIGRVGVAAGSRGLGVGRRVIEEAENWARELGLHKLIITSRSCSDFYYISGMDYFKTQNRSCNSELKGGRDDVRRKDSLTASPIRTERGWEFSLDEGGVDQVLKIRYLPEIYKETDPSYEGRATVPTVVDVNTRKVVNNDYFRLTNYLETIWSKYHKRKAPDLSLPHRCPWSRSQPAPMPLRR
jgi:predicted GNAT family N-acyltransferase